MGADAVVDPDAVVVVFGDAGAAEGAVFAARRFWGMAGAAGKVGVVEHMVVGVGWGGVEEGGGAGTEVGGEVGTGEKGGKEEVVVKGEAVPGGGEEEGCGDRDEGEEEDLCFGTGGC